MLENYQTNEMKKAMNVNDEWIFCFVLIELMKTTTTTTIKINNVFLDSDDVDNNNNKSFQQQQQKKLRISN